MTMTGMVEGIVQDKHGGKQIGAEVEILGTDLIAVTDMDGSYRIEEVPSGEQQIKASMVIGSQTKTVNVPASGTVTVDFTLNPLKPK